jgi:hypothetical protein
MLNSVLRRLSILTIGFSVASTSSAFVTQSQQASSRTNVVDLKNVTGPEDRFFDLSVGSDYLNFKFSDLQLSKTSMHVGDATEVKAEPSEFEVWAWKNSTASPHADLTVTQ